MRKFSKFIYAIAFLHLFYSANFVFASDCYISASHLAGDSSIVLEIKGENNVNDSSGYSHNGANATDLTYETAPFGTAIVFNGTSTYFTIPDNTDMPNGNNFSLAFFLKSTIENATNSYARIINQWLSSSNYAMTISNDGNTQGFRSDESADGSSGITAFTSANRFSTTQYDRFVYVVSSTSRYLYKNGTLVDSASPVTSGVYNAGTSWYVGASQDGGLNAYWKGGLADITYFNKSLTQADVTNIETCNATGGGGGGTVILSPGFDSFIASQYDTLVLIGAGVLTLAFCAGLVITFRRVKTELTII